MASGQTNAWHVAVNGGYVYWSTNGGIFRAPTAGGTVEPVTRTPSTLGNLYDFAVGSLGVYWRNLVNDAKTKNLIELQFAPSAGGPATTVPITLTTSLIDLDHIAASETDLYWTGWGGSGAWVVSTAPLTGGAEVVLASGNSSGNSVAGGLATDAKNVYWLSEALGQVMKVPATGGQTEILASAQASPRGLAIDAQNVYWTADNGASAMKVAIEGGKPIKLGTTASAGGIGLGTAVVSIAVDSAYAYWTNPISGAVLKVAISGGVVMTVASGQQQPEGIAVTAAHVYWANSGDGTIMSIAK